MVYLFFFFFLHFKYLLFPRATLQRVTYKRGVAVYNMHPETVQKYLQIIEREIPAGMSMRVLMNNYEPLPINMAELNEKYFEQLEKEKPQKQEQM